MKTIYGLALTLILSMSCFVQASSYNTVNVTTSASGVTEDKAITKALGIAVQQVNGTQINVESSIHDTDQGIVVDWMGNKTIIPAQEVNSGFTNAKAGGLVQSYRVISSQYIKEAQVWKVSLSVDVTKFANIGKDRSPLMQIVIFPFHTQATSYPTINGNESAAIINNDLNQRITHEFVESNKFRVLDRAYWEESNLEETIINERSYSTQESIKLGQKLGADYMVVGTIASFAINATQQKMYDSTNTVFDTDIRIQLRVIEVATSDIIHSENFTQSFDPRQLQLKINELRKTYPNRSNTQINTDLQNYLYDSVAKSISDKVIARILGTPIPTSTTPSTNITQEAKPLTPGSSEAPIKWE